VRSLSESGNLEGKRGDYPLVRPIDDAAVPPTVNTIQGDGAGVGRLRASAALASLYR